MATEVEEAELVPAGPPWYSKIFEYVKNRNRIGPGKVELPECDFFIVGPRRTLRIIIPTPEGSGYYEPTGNERPETIDENFVSRWAIRPHPSGNCRCSFRQSNRLSTNEERIISAEINRIRTSLCEAEKSGEDIEELEQRISLNFEGLCITDTQPVINRDSRSNVDEKLAEIANVGPPIGSKSDDDMAIKNKIVEDLERYIEVLLQEVLNDTMKFFSDAGHTLKRSREVLKNETNISCESLCLNPEHLHSCESSATQATKIREISMEDDKAKNFGDGPSSLNISFAFHGQEIDDSKEKGVEDFQAQEEDGGYVNRAFVGSNTDPDSLNFDLRKPVNAETLDNLDCIDSGINSVETIEFQPSQEPSLEQSLMAIIDAKLGRAPLKRSWEDLSDINEMKDTDKTICRNLENTKIIETPRCTEKDAVLCNSKEEKDLTEENDSKAKDKVREILETQKENLKKDYPGESSKELDDIENQPNFDKLRLELIGNTCENEKSGISAFREKFTRMFGKNREKINEHSEKEINSKSKDVSSSPVELRVKRETIWHTREPSEDTQNGNTVDFVKFRKSRKPTIVFLHGFGSSAEIFEHQLEYFSNLGYPCIAPEMLGHGMSSAPDRSRDYHFDKLLKDLEIVLHHYAFRPGRKCVLVAHNYGCSFATALACKYGSNIHQLVLISGGGPTPLAPPSSEGAGHYCLRAMLTPLLMCGLHRDILYSARGRQHPYCGPEPPEQRPSHMKYVLDGMVWPEGDYVFHRRICTPTLLIHGLRDNKVSLVQECQMERTIIKAFLDAIPTAGHTPMTDCPEQVNHMIHCFIDLWRRKKR